ncbi:MAG: murein biosynthesis integral membrane protein MurJ [Thermomicrobium sp.]|nr:murein biosynthesis integral membrane protein MurJ [Thermomicrobium sp.]MDW7981797.1 murein biosynthesis integral membrane protein MurJ [Thermomicrobium sp.]
MEGYETRRLARATVIVASLFVTSRVLGLVRDILIAARFGTSPEYDAYVAAFRIPDLVFLVVMSGAFGSAFIPVYGELLASGARRTAWRLANALLSFTIAGYLVASGLTFLGADLIVRSLVAPGLAPDEQHLAAQLTRLLIVSPLCLGIGAAAKAMLESESRFTEPAVAPILYNVGIIIGLVVLVPSFGIFGLATGVLVGAIAYALFQLAPLYRMGWRFRVTVTTRVPGFRDVLSLLGPRLLAQVALHANLLVATNLASRIGSQHIGALNYAYQLFLLPHGIFALSAATVLFPTLTRYRSVGDLDQLERTFREALRGLAFLTLPMTVLFAGLAESIVQTLFQVGAFSAVSTALVADALRWFSPGLFAYATVELLTRLSYAFKDSRSPVLAALVAVTINVAFSLLLIRPLGHRALALSLAVATTVEMVVLGQLLRRHAAIGYVRLLADGTRLLPPLAVLSIAILWLAPPLAVVTDPSHGRSLPQVLVFLYTVGAMIGSYFLVALAVGQPDAIRVVSVLHRSMSRPMKQLLTAILDR